MKEKIETIVLIALFVLAIIFIIVPKELFISKDLDCPQDYCGWIMVDDNTISNGCEFKTVHFPALFKYSLGDTVCKTSFNSVFAARNRKMDSLVKVATRKIKEAEWDRVYVISSAYAEQLKEK